MQDKIIGYLLGALEVEETTYVEEVLKTDTEARRQLEVLRIGLVPFEGDREHVEAPARLAIRTCQRIREVRDCHNNQ
jgi:anti-sigma-K factor RskA